MSLLPKFRRLYVVSVVDNYLKCSCLFHERNGLPCAHTGHVMRKHYNGWDGFTMYDVSIFWWSIKLYASSKVSMGKEVEEMNSGIERIEKK